ncbi:MAG: DNA translocase FtsK 4TM domain-containing protein, partial [Desulfobacterales bacterium]
MRKEILGILFFFLLIFILVSLVSYHPQDPSLNNATGGNHIENLFGLVGAYLADALIGLFGLGAFWVPLLLLFLSIQFFSGRPPLVFGVTIAGGLLLILTSGALLAFQQDHFVLFGNRFSSGGWIGIHLNLGLVRYTNPAGSAI